MSVNFYKLKFKVFLIGTFTSFNVSAQTDLNIAAIDEKATLSTNKNSKKDKNTEKIVITSYIQAQYQNGEPEANLKVGAPNINSSENFNRIGIRRGRINTKFTKGISTGVFQIDITEKGLAIKDAYLKLQLPFTYNSTITVGVFNRPFGHEISYSTSQSESPERSLINHNLFPDGRDLGVKVSIQAPSSSSFNFLSLNAGLFAGNGIKLETDNRRDFIGQIVFNNKFNKTFELNGGISLYNGSVYQGSNKIYYSYGNGFNIDSNAYNKGEYTKRKYYGLDIQTIISTKIGNTKLFAEYIWGMQPGAKNNSKSPNAPTLPNTDVYLRKFNGAYITLVHELKKVPLATVVKYDFYDPNTQVQKNNLGLNNTSIGDVSYYTIGAGLIWAVNKNIKITGYYDWVKNETSKNLSNYNVDKTDNVFTLRIQYKF